MKFNCLIPAAFFGSFCGLSLLGSAIPAQAATMTNVDVELGFVIDGSGSIKASDFSKVLAAHSSLFTDTTFFDTFVKPLNYDGDNTPRIAVSVFQFGSKVKQEIGWTLIDSQAAATAFGQQILGISKTIWAGTSQMGDAIKAASVGGYFNNSSQMVDPIPTSYSNVGILNNNFNGAYKILDLATDGLPIGGYAYSDAAYDATLAGVDAINAIAIGTYDPWGINTVLPNVLNWQEWATEDGATPKGNPNGVVPFLKVAGGIDNYSQVLRKKLGLETIGKPPSDPPPPPPPVIQGDPDPPLPPFIPQGDPDPPLPPFIPQGDPDPPLPPIVPQSVPEPSTLWGLFGLGAIAAVRRLVKSSR